MADNRKNERNNAMKKLYQYIFFAIVIALMLLCVACGKDEPISQPVDSSVPWWELDVAWNDYEQNLTFLEQNAGFLSLRSKKIIAQTCFDLTICKKIADGTILEVWQESEQNESYDRKFVAVETAGGETVFFEMNNYHIDTVHVIAIWINDYSNSENVVFYTVE